MVYQKGIIFYILLYSISIATVDITKGMSLGEQIVPTEKAEMEKLVKEDVKKVEKE